MPILHSPQPDSPAPNILFQSQRIGARKLSKALTRMAGRPILVVNLADLPHSIPDPTAYAKLSAEEQQLTKRQIKERAKVLKRKARKMLPLGTPVWDKWDWKAAVNFRFPTSGTRHAKYTPDAYDPVMTPRLKGEFGALAGIIFVPDRRWTIEEEWQQQLGLSVITVCGGSVQSELLLATSIKDYIFLHELGHVLQCREQLGEMTLAQGWLGELDADRFAFRVMREEIKAIEKTDPMRVADLEKTIEAVCHARALRGFLSYPASYFFALALDADLNGQPTPSAESCRLAAYELRLRVYAQLTGTKLPAHDSQGLQALLQTWFDKKLADNDPVKKTLDDAFGGPFLWADHNDVTRSIPALRAILAGGDIGDPLVQRNAELVLAAADYFCSAPLPPAAMIRPPAPPLAPPAP